MRVSISVLLMLVASLSAAPCWAVCPQDTIDNGECDSLYVEACHDDQAVYPPSPFFVRFPIYVTHDVPNPVIDSISGFVIPLCYNHTNPAGYCSLNTYWNTKVLNGSELSRSIFRHLVCGTDTIHNWMLDLFEQGGGGEWDTRILNLDGISHFRLGLIAPGAADQKFGEGSRVLLATMTFKLEDTMTICVDSCFWPPSSSLVFARSDAQFYIPRHFLPVCERVGIPYTWIECPPDENRQTNRTFQTANFRAGTDLGYVTWVDFGWNPPPPGISNVNVVFTTPLPGLYVEGYVEYTVSDHCLGGGDLWLYVYNNIVNGPVDWCFTNISLTNNPPDLTLPDSVLALADYTVELPVSADDPNNDAVEIDLDAFWYEPDSMQAPTNPPFYDGGNPGLFTWLPAEADTGTWVASFTATDTCGVVDHHPVSILVSILFCGDCTADEVIDIGDVICLINHLFKEGVPPQPLCRGDANCDGLLDIGDVVYLINYLYKGGPALCTCCCAGGL